MAEEQVTVDGVTYPLRRPFVVIATQNPIEHEGTYPLPEPQLDRFIIPVPVGYPSPAAQPEHRSVIRLAVSNGMFHSGCSRVRP
mgnify:CR=1 FL=1